MFREVRKKLFLILLFCSVFSGSAFAADNTPLSSAPSPVEPQMINFESCYKYFKFDSGKLFYLTLAGINANRFKILEMQSKNGYIVFAVFQRQFLASVISINSQNSMLKITPCNNVYYFPAGIVQNMFKYIELNVNTPIEKLKTF